MATTHTGGVPYVSDFPPLKAGEHLQIIEQSGNLAQYVLQRPHQPALYYGLAYTMRRPAEAGSNAGLPPGASGMTGRKDSQEPKYDGLGYGPLTQSLIDGDQV